jgi:hypothetical protein
VSGRLSDPWSRGLADPLDDPSRVVGCAAVVFDEDGHAWLPGQLDDVLAVLRLGRQRHPLGLELEADALELARDAAGTDRGGRWA